MVLTKEFIQKQTVDIFPELLEIRHHLHQNPELSFNESETALYISTLLTGWGIVHQTGVAGNGITGTITGFLTSPVVVALRADMDALPIHESNDVPYRSLNLGVMHACGHDVHMTCLLGTLKLLQDMREHFGGTVKFIFQPAEEVLPGGAIGMIHAGVLKSPDVTTIFGQHVFPELKSGMIGVRSGPYMASSDEINLTITGKGGHGAMPDKIVDTVLAASQVIVSLQQIVSRRIPASTPAVLSFGYVRADGAHNVIPSSVVAKGTFRTFDEKWRSEAHELITSIAKHTASAYGAECIVKIDKGYPVVINTHAEAEFVQQSAVEYLGAEKVIELDIRTTAEDFGYFLQEVPGCFYRLGTRNEALNIVSNLHTSTFDVDEESLLTGTGLMTWITIKRLEK